MANRESSLGCRGKDRRATGTTVRRRRVRIGDSCRASTPQETPLKAQEHHADSGRDLQEIADLGVLQVPKISGENELRLEFGPTAARPSQELNEFCGVVAAPALRHVRRYGYRGTADLRGESESLRVGKTPPSRRTSYAPIAGRVATPRDLDSP